ncbi:MAG: methyltransferase domain-containing protein [Candidatus Woesearchaeota archaeon]|nr:methyltransferase domain-containing protein [Candidatus Woesearchaeota archaeon]
MQHYEEIMDLEATYKKTLHHYAQNLTTYENPFILNLGCGKCLEGEILKEFFNGKLLGVDIDKEAIKIAKENNNSKHAKFYVKDINELKNYIPIQPNVIILRHPYIGDMNWTNILQDCFDLTKIGGLLLVTNCISTEYELSQKPIKRVGYDIEVSEENPHAHFVSRKGATSIAMSDGYITIAKKNKELTKLEKIVRLF